MSARLALSELRPRSLAETSTLIMAEPSEREVAQALADLIKGSGGQASLSDYNAPASAASGSRLAADRLVVVLPRQAATHGTDKNSVARMVERLQGVVALTRRSAAAVQNITFVQFGGGRFGSGPELHAPESCCAAALARSLHLERPDLKIKVVDLSAALEPRLVAAAVGAELDNDAPFHVAGYGADGVRLAPRVRLQQPAQYRKRPISWGAEDVILVTGGAKGITAECALALARTTKARFALVGSSPAPGTNGKSDAKLVRTLERFQQEGITCRYYSCNVSSPEGVQRLISQVRAELGPITGVVHGAAVNKIRRLDQVSAAEALEEVSPKLLGALHLCQALADAPPKLFMAFTSIIGVTGMPGNGWYGFSNEVLDLILRQFGAAHPTTAIQSIAYSVWAEVGMGAENGAVDNLARMGIGAIPMEEGVRRFLQLWEHDPGQKQVIVTARLAGLDTWPVASPALGNDLRFIEKIVKHHPDVELVARTRLTMQRDLYLQDHNYNGSFLFPTVFGLEAMAQAAAVVTGQASPEIVRIERISLEKPIVVDAHHGVEIEIRAEVMEAAANGEIPVRVGIRTEQTGFAADHFAATLILGNATEGTRVEVPTNSPLPIDPLTDLYGDLLFQGPRFQKMGSIFELDSNHTIFASESDDSAVTQSKAFAASQNGRLLLGDPFFRDILLQAGQVTIPQQVCLPVRIEKIERFRSNSAAGRRLVFAPIKVRHGREYVAEIFTTDEEGVVLEKLTGYWLRILEEKPSNPTAEELASPSQRDERLLRESLRAGGERMPALACEFMPRLHALPREDRRRLELPVIERALRAGLQRKDAQACPFAVQWETSNRPTFASAPAEGLELSLAHDDWSCLSVVGKGAQGCDLAPIVARSNEDWNALLGDARMALLKDLMKAGDTLDQAGTRIWSAIEALRKATQADDIMPRVCHREGRYVLFAMDHGGGVLEVATAPVKLTFGPERMVAVVLIREPAQKSPATLPQPAAAVSQAPRTGINPDWHCVSVANDGPQGQPVQELRFVVSFQEASGISRRVPSSRYLTWMGKMRELVTSSNLPQLVEQIATGEWGLVTNWGDVQVFGEVTANDVIQMRFWTDHARGSEVEFFCDFWKVHSDGRMERVAFGQQKATWVRLLGHGQVAAEPLPAYFADFINQMGPRNERNARELPPLPHHFEELQVGAIRYTAPAGPRPRPVWSETVQTSLEESNLVGNVYFANYFAWQNRVKDMFLHAVAPEYLRGIGGLGELVTLRTRVDYLREAMPFEQIQIVMSLRTLSEAGATLGFEYFRLMEDGSREKLSVGFQEVAWVMRDERGNAIPTPWPVELREALLVGDGKDSRRVKTKKRRCQCHREE